MFEALFASFACVIEQFIKGKTRVTVYTNYSYFRDRGRSGKPVEEAIFGVRVRLKVRLA